MKINYDKKATEICINDLTIGKTFSVLVKEVVLMKSGCT